MIYLVEDDESIRELVVYTLNSQGLEAQGFERPSLFWKALEKELPSLVLLDIMLPEEDGLSILKKIRIRPDVRKLPVIMLTAKGSEFDTVVGLDSGADDYIPKPFRMMELISRVRALLRRSEDNGAEEYRMENLYVCPGRHEVTVDQEPVNLTLKEYEMLCLLLKNRLQRVRGERKKYEIISNCGEAIRCQRHCQSPPLQSEGERNPGRKRLCSDLGPGTSGNTGRSGRIR